jgi:3',5'-cyclic AMP phosphodiesterase CpdA
MRRGRLQLAAVALLVAACTGPPEPTGPLHRSVDVGRSFEFVVIGDFGSGDAAEYQVAAAIRSWSEGHPLDAVVTTGDNIYEDGDPDRFEEAWLRPYGWVGRQGIEVLAALGNHDVRTAEGRPVMQLLGMPGPWYAVRLGPVELVVLDGNRPDDDDQREFLGDSLATTRTRWQIVVVHQPPYSCGDEHGSSEDVQELVPALHEGGADLVLSGHDHTYQRFPPIREITFVVSGGGGSRLDAVTECPPGTPAPVAAFADDHHFLYAVASDDELRVKAVRVPGSSVADRVVLPG